jgi:hypothetical protein
MHLRLAMDESLYHRIRSNHSEIIPAVMVLEGAPARVSTNLDLVRQRPP